jgi:hypothetical protein
MRPLILTAIALLTTFASAQTTGRHFRRDERTPPTPAAAPQAPASDAAARTTTTTKVVPLRKLRSGRAWPSYHFSRMPQNTTPAGDGPVDASARSATTQRRGFWRPRR